MLLCSAVLVPLCLSGVAGAKSQAATDEHVLLELPAHPGAAFDVSVMIDGVNRTIRLEPRSMQAPGFQVLVQGDTGALEEWPAPPPSTYRGAVRGAQGSVVTASLESDGLYAIVRGLADDSTWEVVPTGVRTGTRVEHVVQRLHIDSVLPCGGVSGSQSDLGSRGKLFTSGDSDLICEIALDCDYEQYEYLGSNVTATTIRMLRAMNDAAPPFESELGITFQVTAVVVRTSLASDPYQGWQSSLNTLLDLAKAHWELNHQDIPRDMVHLFSHKFWFSPLGGTANVGGVCSCNAYSVSNALGCEFCSANYYLLAHEIGHVLGADECNGQPDCMLMCSPTFQPPCVWPPLQFEFGEFSKNQILYGPNNHTCLTATPPSAPPTLTAISPSQVSVFSFVTGTPPPVTITGSGLAHARGLRIVAPWGQLHGDLCAAELVDDTTILFKPPMPLALGSVQLSALSDLGSSNGLPFEYIAADPPQMYVVDEICVPTDLTWQAASQPGLWAVLLTSYNNPTTTTVGGFSVLANGSATVIGTLDNLGLGSLTRPVLGGLAGGTLYSQLTVYSAGVLVGVSSVYSTQLTVTGCG